MLKQIKNGLIPTSLLYIVLGVFLVGWPDASIRLCCYALGALLILFGGVQIRRYLRERDIFFLISYASLIGGIICCAAGLFLLLSPDTAISLFPILFGLFVVFDSVGRFSSALELHRVGYGRWWNFLLLSLLSIALGLFMIFNPFGTVTAMVTAVGVILLIEGFLNLFGLTYSSVLVHRFDRAAAKLAKAAEEAVENVEQMIESSTDGAAVSIEEDGPIIDVESHPVEDDDVF